MIVYIQYCNLRRGKVDSVKIAIRINVASWRSCLKISKLSTVTALAVRSFQLDIVQGRKLNWMNCLVTRES